jgi:hypothetical protein
LIFSDTSVRSPRGTGSTTSREFGFAILSSWFLLSFWTWQAQGRGETFVPLKSIPAHGRAFVFRTAIGGGLAVEVRYSLLGGESVDSTISPVDYRSVQGFGRMISQINRMIIG